MASTYVNAFVNAGFGKDSLMVGQETPWMHSVKNDGGIAATGSLGMIFMWDIDGGSNEVAEYINA